MPHCLVCDSPIQPFISFGRMPIANGFLAPEDFDREYFFDLQAGFCETCGMVQLTELVEPQLMFHENYAFFSSTSARMATHFERFAAGVREAYLPPGDPFVVEIGCNDGIMLQHFAAAGVRHLGIEPSGNVADVARAKGLHVLSEFFSPALAERIVAEHGRADAFLGANVMCHIPGIHDVIRGLEILLSPTGVIAFEDPYLGDIVEKTSYDQIYDEHAFYFSLRSVGYVFAQHGFEVIDVQRQDVHGGSMRYVIARKGARPVSDAVGRLRAREEALGLERPETYAALRAKIEASREALMGVLNDLRDKQQRVVGYAATSKSTTVINYCGITPAHLEFISDTTPIKQGKYSPGQHIPVKSYQAFASAYPDYALLFGWNHAAEIVAKERPFIDAGGRWIVYVPQVQVLS